MTPIHQQEPEISRRRALQRASLLALGLTLARSTTVLGQEQAIEDASQSLESWAWENLDEDLLGAFEVVDRERIESFLAMARERMQGVSLYDLAELRQPAQALLPFLERFEETEPLAIWLRTRLDYFEVADQLRLEMKQPAPKPIPSPATPPQREPTPPIPPAPPLKTQERVWNRHLENQSIPPEARAYVRQLKPIFTEEKVPPQLVWIAEVESSFNPKAKSPAGARGLFQLMKPTSKRLGLSTFFPDERLDTEKSGRAAARHLRQLRQRYGNWQLALAAYNAGEGRVDQVLKKSRTKSFPAIAAKLPAETQMYVPKLEATLRKREGISLSNL